MRKTLEQVSGYAATPMRGRDHKIEDMQDAVNDPAARKANEQVTHMGNPPAAILAREVIGEQGGTPALGALEGDVLQSDHLIEVGCCHGPIRDRLEFRRVDDTTARHLHKGTLRNRPTLCKALALVFLRV
jgi:hypothetical protein